MSRLRDGAGPIILAENRRPHRASRLLARQRPRDVKAGLAHESVDLLVEVEFKRQGYLGGGRSEPAIIRVVGVRHGAARRHRWYAINVPLTVLSPGEMDMTDAALWEVELALRGLRTHLRIAHLASAKRTVVEALVYAAMIGLRVSRARWRTLRACVDDGRRPSERRVTDALAAIATELAVVLAGVLVTMEQRCRRHALLSGKAPTPPSAGSG